MFEFYSFAHRCRNESGHPFSYHIACQKAIENLNGHFSAYTHEACTLSPMPAGWTPWFPSVADLNKKHIFAKQCRSIFKKKGENRTFFLESFGRRDFRHFALAALLYGRKTDHIWILFRDDHIWKRSRDRAQITLLHKLLRFKFGSRAHLLSDSSAIAIFLSEKLSHPFHVMPLPHIDFPPLPFQKASPQYTLCFLGEPRKEKGIHQILRLLKSYDSKADQFKLILSEAISMESSTLEITTHPKVLSNQQYIDTMASCDILLLPYSSYRYRRRTSGIFVEAIWMGKIPLVQEQTWLADELIRFDLQELIVNWNDPHFFTHLLHTLEEPTVYTKLQKMQQTYTKCHAFDAFTNKIKELLPL